MSTKSGKLPLSQKKHVGPVFDEWSPDSDNFKLSKILLDVFKKHGYSYRFISSLKLSSKGGYHKQGWKPFNINDFNKGEDVIIKGDPYDLGIGPDGTVNRVEMILAIRPKAMNDKHRALIDAKTARQSGEYNKRAAEEMKTLGRRAGIEVKVDEGFED